MRGLQVLINGQRLVLGDDGWEMRAFAGSVKEFVRRVLFVDEGEAARRVLVGKKPQLGLVAKILADSGREEALQRADLVSRAFHDYIEKDEYEFGDITRASLRKIEKGAKDTMSKATESLEKSVSDAKERVARRSRVHGEGGVPLRRHHKGDAREGGLRDRAVVEEPPVQCR